MKDLKVTKEEVRKCLDVKRIILNLIIYFLIYAILTSILLPLMLNFIIDLMGNGKLFEDNGNWTNQATATGGLHAVNYNVYMAQSDEYAKEIENINKELANDPYNTKLLDRRKELLEAQRESIKASEQEKQSIKDLYSQGYDSPSNICRILN